MADPNAVWVGTPGLPAGFERITTVLIRMVMLLRETAPYNGVLTIIGGDDREIQHSDRDNSPKN